MPRKIPGHLTEDEHVSELLERARRLIRANHYDYTADWLKAGVIGSSTWTVIDNFETNTIKTVRFHEHLPDGSLLTDPENGILLSTIQKFAFHLKMGNLPCGQILYKQWKKIIDTSISLARWMVLHSEIFQPSDYGFSLLTDDHVKAYLHDYANGGLANTLKLDDRLIITLHEKTQSLIPLENILATKDRLDESFIQASAEWLNSQRAYMRSKNPNTKVISQKYLGSLLGCSHQALTRYSIVTNIIKQLDLQYSPASPESVVLIPIEERRIGSVTPIVRRTMYTHTKDIKILCSAHNLVNDIPYISESVFKAKYSGKIGLDGHTRLIPLEIGLEAINRAAEIIICFGSQIVEAATTFAKSYSALKRNHTQAICNARIQTFFEEHKLCWSSSPEFGSIRLLTRYNVTSFTSSFKTLDIEAGITFKTLQSAFYGACALIIGMCKPVREGELHMLNLDCLESEFEGGGAELVQILEKSGLLGEHQTIRRPIPFLAARAIQLLQVLAGNLKEIYGDENGPLSGHLFYIPSQGVTPPTGKALAATLNAAIDTFCLISKFPKELNGQPSKIRIHEMRKFFLIVMYSHHDEPLRRALGYAAGHLDENQIDAYTSFSHDDPERAKFESQCISDRLVSLELGQISSKDNNGLSTLYSHICNHFNVNTIQNLRHENFIRFLSLLQCSGAYKSTLYSVEFTTPDGTLTTLEFAIKFEGEQDEKYY